MTVTSGSKVEVAGFHRVSVFEKVAMSTARQAWPSLMGFSEDRNRGPEKTAVAEACINRHGGMATRWNASVSRSVSSLSMKTQ